MIQPRLFLCGGASIADGDPLATGRRVDRLNVDGEDTNITLRIEDVARVFLRELPPRLIDLLEIAAYVFTADAGTRRGTAWENGGVESWSRNLAFRIAVRDLEFWQRDEVQRDLIRTLSFLSDDEFTLDFCELSGKRPVQTYLDLGTSELAFANEVDRVTLFSGGLDSLSGAITALEAGEDLVLVSHRSVATVSSRQRALVQRLRDAYPARRLLHIPVWVNKQNRLGHEPTQRTRSFLFTALGTAVAQAVGAGGIRFFENGIVSLNWPIAGEVLRARASRTTHPFALRLLAQFVSRVLNNVFEIDNPFGLNTKTEVISKLAEAGQASLIGLSVSCAHTMFKSRNRLHCGLCSQCIDRRIGTIASNSSAYDPATDYVTDVFLGPRKDLRDRNMAMSYARHAADIDAMTLDELANAFDLELTRAVQGESNAHKLALQMLDMHKRHARTVTTVLKDQVETNAAALVARVLEPTSMLALIAGQQHVTTTWRRFCERVGAVLTSGLARACRTEQPSNEPRLQELADGILAANEPLLRREFPSVRWSAGTTKPDWSTADGSAWIELKYVRAKRDLGPIMEAIAADLTKYGDTGRNVLFIVYDPHHLITDEDEFAAPIRSRRSMEIAFVR